ncbi:mCG1030770 [Mus musculus]|nr:mCG1030770 [Mus musculus]
MPHLSPPLPSIISKRNREKKSPLGRKSFHRGFQDRSLAQLSSERQLTQTDA